jgi:hypothetical protein
MISSVKSSLATRPVLSLSRLQITSHHLRIAPLGHLRLLAGVMTDGSLLCLRPSARGGVYLHAKNLGFLELPSCSLLEPPGLRKGR